MEYNLQCLIVFFLLIAYYFYAKLDKAIYYPFLFFCLSGLVTAFFPQLLDTYFRPQESVQALGVLSNYSARSVLWIIILAMVPNDRRLYGLYSHMAILNSFYMFYRLLVLDAMPYGLGLVNSFDAVLLAITYPVVLLYSEQKISNIILKVIYRAIPVIAIFISKGSVGLGGLALALFFYYGLKYWMYVISALPLVLIAIYRFAPKYLDDSARYVCWEWSFKWWASNANHWFGTGLGTFSIVGPYVQVMTNNSINNWYIFMHNDWAQCLFETGFIGLAIALSSYLYLLYRARHNRFLLSSLVTYGACALFYYPTKNVVTSLYAVILIKSVLRIDSSPSSKLDFK